MGDFNARVQKKLNEQEQCVGEHTFDKHRDRIGERATDYPTRENREIFINFCNEIDAVIINTCFQKPDDKLMTYKQNSTNIGPPYNRDRYEQIDYVVVPDRWKNSITNCETDKNNPIRSDHFPIITNIKIKLKADTNRNVKVSQIRTMYGTNKIRIQQNTKRKIRRGKLETVTRRSRKGNTQEQSQKRQTRNIRVRRRPHKGQAESGGKSRHRTRQRT